MALHQSPFHMPIAKVLPVAANQIAIPFHPLLKQITSVLRFPDPVYHMLDLTKNSVYVSVETNIVHPSTGALKLTYVGGRANTIEDSCEIAARKAVHDLMKRWGVVVEDLTFDRCINLNQCSQLYNIRRRELQNACRKYTKTGLVRTVHNSPVSDRHVYLDYMPLLRKIFKTAAIQCTPLETVKNCNGQYTSWIIIQPLFNNASKAIFIGPASQTLVDAKRCLAKKVVAYVIPAYNLEIVEANYQSSKSELAALMCNLELESYLSLRGRMNGILDESAFSFLLIERDEMALERVISHVPSITPIPQKKNTEDGGRLASPKGVVMCHGGPYPVAYKLGSLQETTNKRPRI